MTRVKKSLKKNLRYNSINIKTLGNKTTIIGFALIALFLLSLGIIINDKQTKEENNPTKANSYQKVDSVNLNSNEKNLVTYTPTPTPVPTLTSTPAPRQTLGKVIAKYLIEDTNEPLKGVQTIVKVTGQANIDDHGDKYIYTFENLLPGSYTVFQFTPPGGYQYSSSDCSGQCTSGASSSDCNHVFQLQPGQTIELICRFKK